MWVISGTVKSTQLQWLPVLANIAPPKLRREATTVCELVNWRRHARSSCTNRCWIFPIKGCFSVDMCGILIHIRLRRFFQFPMPDVRQCGMVSIATCQQWSDCGSLCSTTWFRLTTTKIGCCWTAFEPSREDAHTSCIVGGSWSYQRVTVLLRNKQCVT
jgi:hypothetical protein